MLKDDLLLDSARAFGNSPDIDNGCSWYALRVSYSRELKIHAHLQEVGVRTFVPMAWRRCPVKPGVTKMVKKLVPAVNNLCFVYWHRQGIDNFIASFGEKSPVHYYWDRTAGHPMIVPDKAMDNFIKVASCLDEELIYITEISDKLREGQSVKVKSGSFAGVTGKIVRIRKSRRILVELHGILAVASTYVSPLNVEIID